MPLEFTDEGPRLPTPVRDAGGPRARSRVFDPDARDGLRRSRRSAACAARCGDVPLIGFAGAPFTRRDLRHRGQDRQAVRRDQEAALSAARRRAHALLALIGEATRAYLLAQVRAGAQAVQLFDSWVGVVVARRLGRLRARADARRSSQAVRAAGVPVIYFPNGATTHPRPRRRTVGADVVRHRLAPADRRGARRRGAARAVQGTSTRRCCSARASEIERRARPTSSRAAGARATSSTWATASTPDDAAENVEALVARRA